MPIYSYLCGSCGEAAEKFLPITKYRSKQRCDSCDTVMDKQLTYASPGHNQALSSGYLETLRRPFGKSAGKMNTFQDVDKHIKELNKEYGLKLDSLSNNW